MEGRTMTDEPLRSAVSHTNEPGGAYRPSYTFTTARAAGDKTPYTMAVFADLGLMGS